MNTPERALTRGVRVGLCAVALAAVVSCGSSTDPGGGGPEVEIVFTPSAANLTMLVGASRELRATVTGDPQPAIAWSVDGAAAGSGPLYVHVPGQVGVDTVSVSVVAGGRTVGRDWFVTVEPDLTRLPPPVNGVAVGHGPQPAEVEVTWRRTDADPYPLVQYLVACSYAGPINAGNWDAALLLGAVPHDAGTFQYRRTFGPDEGMVAGADAWFAVRAQDDRGQLSPLEADFPLTISYPWNLEVTVRDDAAAPLQNAILAFGGAFAFTDAAGRAVIGPLRSIDAVTVTTTAAGHYGFNSGPRSVGDGPALAVTLLRRYAMDHEPCGLNDYVDFLDYFRKITITAGTGERGTRLYRWQSYPVSVWIPARTSPRLGWDLRALAAAALPVWNSALGQDYLVAAADSASADVVFAFVPIPGYNGFTTVTLPAGDIGTAIPQRMRVDIELNLDGASSSPQPVWVTEVALHELGHVLGHYSHTCGVDRGNLMDWGGGIGILADGPQNAIHLDEQRAVRAVRNIPQGADLSGFSVR